MDVFSHLLWLRRRFGRAALLAAVVVIAFVGTRAIAFAAMHAGAARAHPRFAGIWERHDSHLALGVPPSKLVEPLIRWDALFYIHLARNGYPPAREETVYSANFFPLYPLLVRAGDRLLGNTYASSLILSNACALAAALLVAFSRREGSRSWDGARAAVALLAFPGSHFLSLPYSEGLFLLLAVASLLWLERGLQWRSGLAAAAACATRSAGVALIVALLWEGADRLRRSTRSPGAWFGAAALAAGGLATYCAFCSQRYGHPFYWVRSQASFGRVFTLTGPLRALFGFNVDPDYYLVTIACIVVTVLLARRRLDASIAAGFVLLVLPMASGTLKAMIRYQTVNVPLFCGVAEILRGRWFAWTIAASTALMAVEAFLYGRGLAHY